jgi:hypothetical protein
MFVVKFKYQNRIAISVLVFTAIIANRCAQIGTISGGPKDLDPPEMVRSTPKNFTTNFKGKKVKIDFNEYVQLKDVNQQFNISPPLKKKPLVSVFKKSVIVQYTDTLKDSTTYTLNFGNSIVDNNEGNILRNFDFAFSTGSYVDSMCVRGKILDAFSLLPDKEPLLAMLYKSMEDSAPCKEVPLFTARTDKDGYYSINNVKPGTYKLYALKDKNFNYKYDPASEQFAFIDTVVVLNPERIAQLLDKSKIFPPDTAKAKKDTVHKTVIIDSLMLRRERNSIYIDLFTFMEKDKNQFIKDYNRKDRKCLSLVFNNPLKDNSINLLPVYYENNNWYRLEETLKKDSVLVWIIDTNLIKTDTLRTIVEFWATNKKGDTLFKNDTLNFKFIKEVEVKLKKGKKPKPETMKVQWSGTGAMDLNARPFFETQYPIARINKDSIILLQKIDTIFSPCKFDLFKDSIYPRRVYLSTKWADQTAYKLTIYPGAFKNIYDLPTDTQKINFNTQKLDYYGKLKINLEGVKIPIIVQLMEKDKVLYERRTATNGPLVFDLIQPKKYSLKIIFDENNDNYWTTGDFKSKRQPEKVIFYKDEVNIRSNWDLELSWEIR